MADYILITCTGKSLDKKEVSTILGVYKHFGEHDGSVCYQQMHSLGDGAERGVIYRNQGGPWSLSSHLGAGLSDCSLKSDANSAHNVPTSGWKYKAGTSWLGDPGLRLESLSSVPEPGGDIVITAEEELPCLGAFAPLGDEFSCGRRIFKHANKDYYLLGAIIIIEE